MCVIKIIINLLIDFKVIENKNRIIVQQQRILTLQKQYLLNLTNVYEGNAKLFGN